MTSRVLVTGASIAGPTVAFWLDKAGYDVTVVERAPHLRHGGQNIDVRGSGREVLRRMGLDATLLANGTTEKGTRFVDENDATIAAFPVGDGSHDGPTAELEILRGEFARILVESAGPRTEYRYGDSVVGVAQDADGVDVTFASNASQRFDLVLFADGIRSSSRELAFPAEAETTPVGLYTAYGVLPKGPSDDGWWRWCNAPGSRVANIRPDNLGTTRFSLSWVSDDGGYEGASTEQVITALRAKFADVGWEVPRILNSLGPDSELYVDYLAQVKAPRWSNGRIGMLGDAAWCATPVSGMGTTLSVTGAYVLAGELARAEDHRAGFEAFETRMRPFVEQAQKLPPGVPRIAHPKTAAGVAAFRGVLRLAGSKPVQAVTSKFLGPDAATLELPNYVFRS
ncbi:FAD-dependent monooxygenase [Rhodococcus sp. IEGM 1381]|uniref:FAD-dependent monooxygenase n=1 Tax=Rhodococcus sp. IEGM 1381 TaxID=3047085 RepID=UPI0024B8401D|nr:FAD-dependent monooxygenase [Rhodococcus sp. IEGM 1381]MDI9894699.1 FAD-dependent monooxygenase [Rhodococcus sp. IEGM 1381]